MRPCYLTIQSTSNRENNITRQFNSDGLKRSFTTAHSALCRRLISTLLVSKKVEINRDHQNLWYHNFQSSRLRCCFLLYLSIWHHLNFYDIHLKSYIFSELWYWQVMSPIIEIPRQYPAQTPPHLKKYPAYPASTPPVLIKTIPRHSGAIYSAGIFYISHCLKCSYLNYLHVGRLLPFSFAIFEKMVELSAVR